MCHGVVRRTKPDSPPHPPGLKYRMQDTRCKIPPPPRVDTVIDRQTIRLQSAICNLRRASSSGQRTPPRPCRWRWTRSEAGPHRGSNRRPGRGRAVPGCRPRDLGHRQFILANEQSPLGIEDVLEIGDPRGVLGQHEIEGALGGAHRLCQAFTPLNLSGVGEQCIFGPLRGP